MRRDIKNFPSHPLKGFSLVELLVATMIGLVLISGMIAVFSGNKHSNSVNTAMANLQENARFALDKIADDIRMAGFQGCVDINRSAATVLATVKPTDNYYASATQASLIAIDGSWIPAPPLGFNRDNHTALPGTHALTLQFGSQSTFPLSEAVGSDDAPDRTSAISVDITDGSSSYPFDLAVDDYALISDCTNADIFRVSALAKTSTRALVSHSAPSNTSGALSTEYAIADTIRVTKIMRFVSNVYYVGSTGLTNDNGDAITALYQQSLPFGNVTDNPPIELIRGIENMRVSFGLRTSADSLVFVEPDDARFDPSQVQSIRIGLLMNSFERLADNNDQNVYMLAGQAIPPKSASNSSANGTHAGDKRFRLAFNTTVKVRNRRPTATEN